MSKLGIFLLDKSNNIKSEGNMIKPQSYKQLLQQISNNFQSMSEYIEIFIIDKNNKEIIIDEEEKYSLIGDIIFIRAKDKSLLEQSLFERNFNKLSESKQDILSEKYNCTICSIIIKNENPYFCYVCQKLFHDKCLKEWDKKRKAQNKTLKCPNCRNELAIEKWNKKLNFEENRNDNANLLNKINEYRLNKNLNNNLNSINEKKKNDLKDYLQKQKGVINNYLIYIEKTIEIFKKILKQINSIHTLLNLKNNNKLNTLINSYPLSLNNLDIDEISNVINDEFEQFKLNLKYGNNNDFTNQKYLMISKINNIISNLSIINSNINSINEKKLLIQNDLIDMEKKIQNNNIIQNNYENKLYNNRNNEINDVNKNKILEKPKEVKFNNIFNLKYFAKSKGKCNIFGQKFMMKNNKNITLLINNKEKDFRYNYDYKCDLKIGENIITIIIKDKIIDFSHMFDGCIWLKDISELKNLDISEAKDLSYMFNDCSLISDIRPIENWDVSNCHNFK